MAEERGLEQARTVQLPVPEAELPANLQCGVYANEVSLSVSDVEAVLDFSLRTPKAGLKEVANIVVARVILPRVLLKKIRDSFVQYVKD